MGSFERFKTKTRFDSLKRLVGITALAALAVKLLAAWVPTLALGLPARDRPPQRVRDRLPGPRGRLAADRLGRHPPPDRHHRAPVAAPR
jgi:hypothetical protein